MAANSQATSSPRSSLDETTELSPVSINTPPTSHHFLSPPSSQPRITRPSNIRRCTDPSTSDMAAATATFHYSGRPSSSHRSHSPFSSGHSRSRSTGTAAAYSNSQIYPSSTGSSFRMASRVPDYSTFSTAPSSLASPLRPPARQRSPFRQEDSFSAQRRHDGNSSGSLSGGIPAIQEDSELQIAPKYPLSFSGSGHTLPTRSASTGTPRRRPVSPLHSASLVAHSPTLPPTIPESQPITTPPNGFSSYTSTSSTASSPSWQRYNETYPSGLALHHSASTSSFGSSIPSSATPTSQRSRSPSISSLETIEDDPDLECAAVEADLRLAAERAETAAAKGEEDEEESAGVLRPRRSLDSGPRGFGFGNRSANRERKRWSVCGGERRADLDLETIYED
jgi:hypothetical protein